MCILETCPRVSILACLLVALSVSVVAAQPRICQDQGAPQLIILGIAQDGGDPQAGTKSSPAFEDYSLRHFATSLAVVIPADSSRWLFEATPDFKDQLHALDVRFPVAGRPGLSGIFLTHAHIGHYLGLAQVGHEAMGAHGVPVYAMPRMRDYLSTNGPWDQLVRLNNIELRPLEDRATVVPTDGIEVTAMLVPHRDEYSETVGFKISGPHRSALFIPDINKWERWDDQGVRIEDVVADVDLAFLDGTFFANGEIPGRDMSLFPHPFVSETMDRFDSVAPELRSRVYFIHMNHTNPAIHEESAASREISRRGFNVARRGDCFAL